ncbi:MAG: hypothetical protein AAF587_08470 [Bacteroidota bacterium]
MNTFLSCRFCLFLLCFLICIPHIAHSQETHFENWGIGLIFDPNQDVEGHVGAIAETLSGLVLFDDVDGAPIGKILGTEGIQLSCEKQVIQTDPKDLREYGYEINGLMYWEERSGYFRILNHTFPEGIWIRKSELIHYQWKTQSWMDFICQNSLYLYPERLGISMNLRAGPRASAALLVTMHDDHFQIHPTGKTNGLWAEVKVDKYSGAYCSGETDLEKSWTGWVKLLDDKGHPNLWTYTRGC